jgi:hypothetical protein
MTNGSRHDAWNAFGAKCPECGSPLNLHDPSSRDGKPSLIAGRGGVSVVVTKDMFIACCGCEYVQEVG